MVRSRVVVVFVMLVAAMPAARAAQPDFMSRALECRGSSDGASKVSRPGPYDERTVEHVRLASDVDGDSVDIGIVRPVVPDGVLVPVIARGSPYFFGGPAGDPGLCVEMLAENYVQHGYAVAVIPIRGTADNGGCFDYMGPAERADLDKAVRWLGTQPWSNGSVGMIGLSYDGSTPWEVAGMGNPYLKTIVPISGVNDIFALMHGSGLHEARGAGLLTALYYAYGFANYNVTNGRSAPHMASGAACPATAQALAADGWALATGERDPLGFYAARNLRPLVEENYRGSILLTHGLQDWNVEPGHAYPWVNSLEDRGIYVQHMLGQWGHSYPDRHSNGLSQRGDWADMLLTWFDRWLKGDESVELGARAEVQDHAGRWRRADSWPPRATTVTTLHLNADGRLGGAPGAQTGVRPLLPFTLGRIGADGCTGCDHVAYFESEAVETETRFAGRPAVAITVTPSASSGHITAHLYAGQGESIYRVGWGGVDLRFPRGGERAQAVVPGVPMNAQIDLEPLDVVLQPGDKLWLTLTQGTYSDHVPVTPAPAVVSVGAGASTLRLGVFSVSDEQYFSPRWIDDVAPDQPA